MTISLASLTALAALVGKDGGRMVDEAWLPHREPEGVPDNCRISCILVAISCGPHTLARLRLPCAGSIALLNSPGLCAEITPSDCTHNSYSQVKSTSRYPLGSEGKSMVVFHTSHSVSLSGKGSKVKNVSPRGHITE